MGSQLATASMSRGVTVLSSSWRSRFSSSMRMRVGQRRDVADLGLGQRVEAKDVNGATAEGESRAALEAVDRGRHGCPVYHAPRPSQARSVAFVRSRRGRARFGSPFARLQRAQTAYGSAMRYGSCSGSTGAGRGAVREESRPPPLAGESSLAQEPAPSCGSDKRKRAVRPAIPAKIASLLQKLDSGAGRRYTRMRFRRGSQVVRQRFAKPSHTGSNPVRASSPASPHAVASALHTRRGLF